MHFGGTVQVGHDPRESGGQCRRLIVVYSSVLFLLACLAYANSFPGLYILDDIQIVKKNPLVESPDLFSIFTTDYWGLSVNSGLYRPLTILSFAMDRAVFGPEAWGSHLVNLFLHAAVGVLLFLALLEWGGGAFGAFMAAALFAVHPIHTEVLNEAIGRAELLVAVFYFMGLVIACRRQRFSLPLVLLCYGLALLSKEHAISFLVVLPVIRFFRGRDWKEELRQQKWLYLWLVLETLAWLALRTWGVDRTGVPEAVPVDTVVPLALMSPGIRVLTALKLQIMYVGKLLYPLHLQGIYSGEAFFAPVESIFSGWGLVIVAGLAGTLGVVVYGLRRRSPVALAILLYLVSFSPTTNIFVVAGVTFAERLTYLPSAWFCTGLAFLVLTGAPPARFFRLRQGFLFVLMLGLMGLTLARNSDFSSPRRLWEKDVARNPENAQAWMFLADARFNEGDLGGARQAFDKLVEVAPTFSDGYVAYSEFLLQTGDPAAALKYAQLATRVAPRVISAPAYLIQAVAFVRLDRPREALKALGELRGLYQEYGAYWDTQGRALAALGDYLGALQAFKREQRVYFPESSDVLLRISDVYLKLGNVQEAERAVRAELERKKTAEAWNRLGKILVVQGRYGEAERAFSLASDLDPDAAEYRINREMTANRRSTQDAAPTH